MSNIRKGVLCYQGGRLVTLDLDDHGSPVTADGTPSPAPASGPSNTDPLKEADKIDGPTKLELIAALKEKGIKFNATMSKVELATLLKGGGNADASPPAEDPPRAKGAGDQDVI